MSAQLFYLPFNPVFTSRGLPAGAAQAFFYYTGTTAEAPVYSDDGLTQRLSQPVKTNALGGLPNIYMDGSITYRVRIIDASGAQLGSDIDEYIPGTARQGVPGPPGAGGNVAITRAQLKTGPAAAASPGDIWQLSDPTGDIIFKMVAGAPPMIDPGEDQYIVVNANRYFARVFGETDAVAAAQNANALILSNVETAHRAAVQIARSFSPAQLFTPGVNGVWTEPNDLSTLFSDYAGTKPATVNGDVRFARDKSGNGNHDRTPDSAPAPQLRQDGNGNYYLDYTGTQYLQANFTQPFSIAFDRVSCIQPTAWTNLAYIYGGGGGANAQTPDVGVLLQAGASPQAVMFAGTRSSSFNIPVGQISTITEHFFAGNSRVRVNNGASTSVGSVGGGGPQGVTIGCAGVGTNFASFRFYGMVMIDRQLTETELSLLNQYVSRAPMPLTIGDLGDSTEASNPSSHPMPPVFSFIPDVNLTLVAHAGDTIAVQRQKFAALDAATKQSFTAVMIGIGLNDVPNLLAADPAASALPLATTMAALQGLLADIRAAVTPYCRIYIRTMTPANGRYDVISSTPQIAAFLRWKWAEMNKAIAGFGPYAITGVDGRVTEHTVLLQGRPGDPGYVGPGYLSTDFDVDADHIHPSFWGRRIIANCDRAVLVGDGLLKAS